MNGTKQLKKSFIVYADWEEYFEDVSEKQLAAVFKALFRYAADGTEPEFKGAARSIFRMMKNCLDRDAGKWEDKCRKNAENGRKGGLAKAAKKAALPNGKNSLANLADSESDSVSESVSDSDRESESESEREKACSAGSASPSPAQALGEFGNVFLSEEEKRSLAAEFGRPAVDKAVNEISEYCASLGKRYKSWPAAVRRWIKRDNAPRSAPAPRPNYHSARDENYDLDEWMKTALSLSDTWDDIE